MNETNKKDVLRPVDKEGIILARRLLRQARYASLASLDHETGYPLASRVTLANDVDGTPIILISELSSHTPALLADARCSLLVGELGQGDPLAHPRMTLICKARQLSRQSEEARRSRQRFLARHPAAELYADFGDFHFFKLKVEAARLNGGFAKAYALDASHVILGDQEGCDAFFDMEEDVVSHMNDDHQDSISHYVKIAAPDFYQKTEPQSWRMTGIDPEGMDLRADDQLLRIPFDNAPIKPAQIRAQLIKMAKASAGSDE